MNTKNISIVVPCYNSEKSIEELIKRTDMVFKGLHYNYEFILVNDCSKDNTIQKIDKLTKTYANIVGIDLMFNVGQFRALMCGLEHANGDYVITMDDDLQHPPEEIPALINELVNDSYSDIIIGKPILKNHKAYRNIGSSFIRWVNHFIFNKPKHLHMASFRIMRKQVVKTIVSHKTMFPVLGPLILKSTSRIKNIDVEHHPRIHGKSNYSFISLISNTFTNIINFSSLPLKLISYIGIGSFNFSIILSLYYLIRYLFGGIGVAGWTSSILLLNFYGGLILFSIGIIGEYLIRIIYEVNKFPRYKIRTVFKQKEK